MPEIPNVTAAQMREVVKKVDEGYDEAMGESGWSYRKKMALLDRNYQMQIKQLQRERRRPS